MISEFIFERGKKKYRKYIKNKESKKEKNRRRKGPASLTLVMTATQVMRETPKVVEVVAAPVAVTPVVMAVAQEAAVRNLKVRAAPLQMAAAAKRRRAAVTRLLTMCLSGSGLTVADSDAGRTKLCKTLMGPLVDMTTALFAGRWRQMTQMLKMRNLKTQASLGCSTDDLRAISKPFWWVSLRAVSMS